MSATTLPAGLTRPTWLRPAVARSIVGLALFGGAAAGFAWGAPAAGAAADPELLRLLRAMAALKLLFAAAATGAILWRLQLPVAPLRLAGYAFGAAATLAGPGLLWNGAHPGAAALLLHGGLAASLLLLWQDPATSLAIERAIARRRQRRAA